MPNVLLSWDLTVSAVVRVDLRVAGVLEKGPRLCYYANINRLVCVKRERERERFFRISRIMLANVHFNVVLHLMAHCGMSSLLKHLKTSSLCYSSRIRCDTHTK